MTSKEIFNQALAHSAQGNNAEAENLLQQAIEEEEKERRNKALESGQTDSRVAAQGITG